MIPICAGWFGEIDEDFNKTIKILAPEAAVGEDGIMSVCPLVNADRNGGAFPILFQQFRRVIWMTIVRRNSKHRLRRLHYMRGTAEEAANTCRTNSEGES